MAHVEEIKYQKIRDLARELIEHLTDKQLLTALILEINYALANNPLAFDDPRLRCEKDDRPYRTHLIEYLDAKYGPDNYDPDQFQYTDLNTLLIYLFEYLAYRYENHYQTFMEFIYIHIYDQKAREWINWKWKQTIEEPQTLDKYDKDFSHHHFATSKRIFAGKLKLPEIKAKETYDFPDFTPNHFDRVKTAIKSLDTLPPSLAEDFINTYIKQTLPTEASFWSDPSEKEALSKLTSDQTHKGQYNTNR